MIFARPWLLFLIPLLWAGYFLLDRARRRPVPVLIPDLSWLPPPGSESEARARRAPTIDLVLALAAIAALVMALSGPALQGAALPIPTRLVIDRGAPLGAFGRMERSRDLAGELIDALPEDAPVELWSSPPDPEGPWRGLASGARSALGRRAGPVPFRGALERRLGAALLGGARVIAVVDRPPVLARSMARRVGLRASAPAQDNWGIVAASCRREDAGEQLSVSLLNAAETERSVRVELWVSEDLKGEERRVRDVPVKVGGGGFGLACFAVEPSWLRARVALRLDGAADALAWDNEAYLLRHRERALEIGLEDLRGEGPKLTELRRALASIPGAVVKDGLVEDGFQVVVGHAEPSGRGPELLIVPPLPEDAVVEKQEAKFLRGGAGEVFGAVLEDSATFLVGPARAAPPPGLGALRPFIVTAKDGAMLGGVRGRGRGLLAYLGFVPSREVTLWVVKRPTFPLALLALVDEARGADSGLLSCLPTGSLLPGTLSSGPTAVRSSDRRARWPGLYRVSIEGREETVAAALLDAEASRLPAFALDRAPTSPPDAGGVRATAPLDSGAAALAAVLLLWLAGRRARSARAGGRAARARPGR